MAYTVCHAPLELWSKIGQKKIPMNPDEKSRENPPWTMFFEGPLYQKYDEYMKNHDFSKILQNKRLQLSSETSKATEKPQSKNSDPWENPEYDNVVPIASQFKVPSLDSYEYQEDKRRRRRRTCCFVCSGMLVIALLSLATALIIHYVFIIEPKEADLKTQVNVSVDGNDVEPKINGSLLNLHAGGSQSTTDNTLTTSSKETSPVTTTALKDISMIEIDNLLGGLNSNLKADFMDELFKLVPKRFNLGKTQFRTTTNNSLPKPFAFLSPPSTSTAKATLPSTLEIPKNQESRTSSSSPSSPSQSSVSVTHFTATSESPTSEGKTSFYISSTSKNKMTTRLLTTPDVIYKSSSPTIKMTTRHLKTPFSTQGVKSTSFTPKGTYSSVTNSTHYTKASTESTTSTTIPSSLSSFTSTVSSTTEQFSPSSSLNPSEFVESIFPVTESSTSSINTTTTSVTLPMTASTIDNVSFVNHSETIPTTILPASEISFPPATTDIFSVIDSSETIPTSTVSEVSNIPTNDDSSYDFYTTSTVNLSTLSSNISGGGTSTTTDTSTSSSTVDSTLDFSTSSSVPLTSEEVTSTAAEITVSTTTDTSAFSATVDSTLDFSTSPSVSHTSEDVTSTPLQTSHTTLFLSTLLSSTAEPTSKLIHTSTSSPFTTLFPTLESSTPTSLSPTWSRETTPEIQTPAKTTLTRRSLSSIKTSVSPVTTTTTQTPTTLPPFYNVVEMKDVTAYTFEETRIHCDVKVALKWNSLAIRKQKGFRPLELKLYPDGEIKWKSKFTRHRAEYLIEDGYGEVGNNVTLDLIIGSVQCRDGDIYTCILISDVIDQQAINKLTTVGKPGKNIKLSLGPSIIEDRAVRLTVTWDGGYPIPWTNISWSAVDRNNNSYDLTQYGEYKEFVLQVDNSFCQTRMQQDFVIFPKMHLNGTTIIVSPDLKGKKQFVNEEMTKDLENVKPGIQSIMVIPLDYCPNNKEEAIPHPYEDCRKFVWCLPGDLVVQQCPYGTCFFEKYSKCLAI